MKTAKPSKSAPPSPTIIFNTFNAYQQSAALRAAIEFDLFTAIGEGTNSAAALAKRCSATERGMRILCDFLTVHGFLTKTANRYGLTPVAAALLDRRSPKSIASVARLLGSSAVTDNFKDIAAIVRKRGTVTSEQGSIAPENPIWVDFARGMAPMMALPAESIARILKADRKQKWKVLDIAAGHGLFGITLAKHNPNAEIVALDWPKLLEVAKENAEAAGVASRFRTLTGNAFEVEYGTGYDVVLLTNFLHHFDAPTCEKLLRKVHRALGSNGRAVALEFVPNEDRITPPVPACFSMIMLGTTPSGDAYTF